MTAQTANTDDDPILQWVTFRLEQETYGINVMQVREVLRHSEIAPVPGAPAYVIGIINLRGNVVTVVDTRERFGLRSTEISDSTRIVILETEAQVVGIQVDAVAEVVYLRQSEIEPAPNVGNSENARYIQGVSHKNDRLLILIAIKNLLNDHEWAELSDL